MLNTAYIVLIVVNCRQRILMIVAVDLYRIVGDGDVGK